MREHDRLTSALVCLVCCSVGFGQLPGKPPFAPGGMPPGGMPPPSTLMLLSEKSVQTDLKLSAAQTSKLSAEMTTQQRAMQNTFKMQPEQRMAKMHEIMTASGDAAEKVLTDVQKKRLKQISLQLQGSQAFANPDVVNQLKLTEEQKEKIKAINDGIGKQMANAFQGRPNPQLFEKQLTDLKTKANTQAKQVLTSEQTAAWNELTGTAFRGQVRMMPPMGMGPPSGFGPPPTGFPPKQ